MSEKKTIKSLLAEELKDLYSAEKQLTKALPKLVRGSNDPDLKEAFSVHLRETQEHVTRLEEAAGLLALKPAGKKCMGMEGLIKEGAEALQEDGDDTVLDLGLIGAGSRVEHYEIAAYLTAIDLAERIGATDVASLLKISLDEEQGAEKKLRTLAAELLRKAPVAESVSETAGARHMHG
jgi:ferritin-like metal-binding protein YciE